jgi:hypothetical protein
MQRKLRLIAFTIGIAEGCFWLLMAHVGARVIRQPFRIEPWVAVAFAVLPWVASRAAAAAERHTGRTGQCLHLVAGYGILVTMSLLLIMTRPGGSSFWGILPYLAAAVHLTLKSTSLLDADPSRLIDRWRYELPPLFLGLLMVPNQPLIGALVAVYFLALVAAALTKVSTSPWVPAGAVGLAILMLLLTAFGSQHAELILFPVKVVLAVVLKLFSWLLYPVALLLGWLSGLIHRISSGKNPPGKIPFKVPESQFAEEVLQTVAKQGGASIWLLVLLGTAAVVLVGWLLWRSLKNRSRHLPEDIERESLLGSSGEGRKNVRKTIAPANHAVQKLYRHLQRYGARRDYPRLPQITPAKYSEQLAKRQPEVSLEVETITDVYSEWRYSELEPAPAEIEAALRAARKLDAQKLHRRGR